jgi:hypothetical protein
MVHDLPTCWSVGYADMPQASTHQRLQRCVIGLLTSNGPEKAHLCPFVGQKRCAPRHWLSLADECTAWSVKMRAYLLSRTSGPIHRCSYGYVRADNAVQKNG